ncbi:3TM-type holin [Porticoccaceae bacterium]|jgi:uncharacterized membrane protein|nr:3TM-type holin [Porticoccaceae bacterium]|tara:strand:- start:684 stop:1100 length:417 start_codon:yes stop_codon:yes gene_type:complete
MSLGITELIAGIFKPATELIDNLHTSKEEKLEQKRLLLEVQGRAMDRVHEYNTELLMGQAKIVNSEASSEHWLTANWRPLVMLTFTGLVVARFLGFEAEGMTEKEYQSLWNLITLGVGGYIGGRSVEKAIKTYKGTGE